MAPENIDSLTTSVAQHQKEQKGLVWKLVFLLVVILTAVTCSYYIVTQLMIKEEVRRNELLARTAAAKDVEMRDWMATFGGVYVPITDHTPPNPYLNIANRDIFTPDGTPLTKMNPAYVTRLLHERWGTKYGMVGHITSTLPIRPENIAAPWEEDALAYLVRTNAEDYSTIYKDEKTGQEYLRHMTPLYARPGCLVCHTTQGYKVGDVMGGISNLVPVAHMQSGDALVNDALLLGHIIFALFILILVFFGGRSLIMRNNARYEAENALRDLAENLDLRVRERTEELQEIQQKLREDRDLLHSIVNGSPMPMYIADQEGIVQVINPAAEHLLPLCLGCKSEFAWVDAEEEDRLFQSVRSMKEVINGYSVRLHSREEGMFLETRANISSVFYEGRSAFLVWIQDVSDLVHAKDQAEKFSRAKSDFLARMSHEIRTPMNAILGMTYLFLQNPLEDWQKRYITKIQEASKGLLGIINDILDFSKIEAGKMTLEVAPFTLSELVENLSNICSPMAEDKKLELLFYISPELPDFYEGDILRISQVLTNLLSNAIKFTNFGDVVLRMYPVGQNVDNSTILGVEVKDSGIGMTEEQMGRLFQSFEQADVSTTRKYGGTGLGLVICDQLVRMMGGEVKVASVPNQGTTFSFQLPLKLHTSEHSFKYGNLSSGERVLVVDDNDSARTVLRDMIAGFGFRVDTVASGHAACDSIFWEAGHGSPYSLVLLDWKMPGLDGFECAKMINELPITSPPKLMMISAYGLDEYTMKGNNVGFTDYVSKPVTRSSLWNSMAKALGKEHLTSRRDLGKQADHSKGIAGIKGSNILLVEDNETNQEVASKLLRRMGMDVVIASNGLEAVNICKARDFDLVFMDIQMPVMDGLEASRRIRADEGQDSSGVPIVAMTAHAMQSDRLKSLEAGMNDHITKPIDPDTLSNVLVKWIPPRNIEVSTELLQPAGGFDGQTADQPSLSIVGLNVAKGLRNVGDDMESLLHHLRRFPARYGDYSAQIGTLALSEQWEEANRTAHTLKGVAATLGMTDIADSAAELEKGCSNKNLDTEFLEKLRGQLEVMCAGINQHLAQNVVQESAQASGGQGQQDIAMIIRDFKTLPDMLSRDIRKCMAKVVELKQHVPGLVSADDYDKVYNAIYEFNSEVAAAGIEGIIKNLESKQA